MHTHSCELHPPLPRRNTHPRTLTSKPYKHTPVGSAGLQLRSLGRSGAVMKGNRHTEACLMRRDRLELASGRAVLNGLFHLSGVTVASKNGRPVGIKCRRKVLGSPAPHTSVRIYLLEHLLLSSLLLLGDFRGNRSH